MGCMCSQPKVVEHDRPKAEHFTSIRHEPTGRPRSILSPRRIRSGSSVSQTLSVQEVLELAQEVVREDFQGSVDPLTVAAIALIESSGNAKAFRWEENLGEARHGLCLMLFSTVRWLMSLGHNEHTASSASGLQSPKVALYFGAAYLNHLSEFNGEPRSEEFVVRSYHKGPKCTDTSLTDHYWRKYRQARQQLQRLHWAMGGQDSEGSEGPLMHIVQSGESLSLIAKVCGTTVVDILAANPEIKDANGIRAGDCIEIPVKSILPRFYVVQSGDTMASIARRHEVSLMRLLKVNPDIKSPSHIQAGWVVSLPGLRGTSCEQVDLFDRSDLICSSVDDGMSFLAAMAGKYGISLSDGMPGEGIGIHSQSDGMSRLGARFNALRVGGPRI
ncbi:unnamed protein product [Ostreobium quekettii]|uniref:LysM domain-containing protein n=1 Tax=Ostreobium quekettii TaxID=121088 RepID=A0A8S1IQT4_9CHLO|nr:unnamed protein product [Ostreobium quekettii]|eukprot:evm.model.scf_139.1 EVM.evm.TU.scf_139.1   scf_139:17309-23130(-)